MADATKKELEDQIAYLKARLTELKDQLEELEIKDNVIDTKHVSLQLSETFKGLTWKEAMDLPRTLNEKKYLGFDDWYLPDVSELFLLIESGWKPKIKEKKYTGANGYSQDDYFWSANSCKDHNNARRVDVDFLSTASLSITSKCCALCVRNVGKPHQVDEAAEPAELFEEENEQISIA